MCRDLARARRECSHVVSRPRSAPQQLLGGQKEQVEPALGLLVCFVCLWRCGLVLGIRPPALPLEGRAGRPRSTDRAQSCAGGFCGQHLIGRGPGQAPRGLGLGLGLSESGGGGGRAVRLRQLLLPTLGSKQVADARLRGAVPLGALVSRRPRASLGLPRASLRGHSLVPLACTCNICIQAQPASRQESCYTPVPVCSLWVGGLALASLGMRSTEPGWSLARAEAAPA